MRQEAPKLQRVRSARQSATLRRFPRHSEDLITLLIGAPWQPAGRTLAGLDCLGVVLWFFQQCGFDVHDPLALTFEELVASPFKDQFYPVDLCDFGDVVHFGGLGEHHIGIATFGGVLQATKDRGVVVLPWWSAFQQSPMLGAYRLKALGVLAC